MRGANFGVTTSANHNSLIRRLRYGSRPLLALTKLGQVRRKRSATEYTWRACADGTAATMTRAPASVASNSPLDSDTFG